MTRRTWGAALVAVCLAAAPAVAKNISIAMTPTAELKDGALNVTLSVSNLGDEAAQSVVPAVHFGDKEARGKGVPSLGPKEVLNETLSIPVGDLAPGRWPYRLTIDYTDANQYPFQALHVPSLVVGNPGPAKIAVSEIKGTTVSSSGSLDVKIKNLANAPRGASLQVLVPDGLEVPVPSSEVTLAPWEEKTVAVAVTNRTALAGSRLPVFVALQYDDAGTHQAVVAQNLLEIVPVQAFFAKQRGLLMVGAALLVLAWGGFVVARMVRTRS